jgi:hypothetical protein
MYDEPYGYDTDGDGFIDTDDRGSFFGYDFDGDGDIDADDDFYGFMTAIHGNICLIARVVYCCVNNPEASPITNINSRYLKISWTKGAIFLHSTHIPRQGMK